MAKNGTKSDILEELNNGRSNLPKSGGPNIVNLSILTDAPLFQENPNFSFIFSIRYLN